MKNHILCAFALIIIFIVESTGFIQDDQRASDENENLTFSLKKRGKFEKFNDNSIEPERYIKGNKLSLTKELTDSTQDQEQVGVKTFGDTYYYTEIEMGSQKQKLEIMIDTGSSLLWVDTIQCKETQKCHKCEYFDYKASTTSYISSQVINYRYASGQLTCLLGSDIIGIPNTNLNVNSTLCYTYIDQTFGDYANVSGIIGLANNNDYKNLITSLYDAGKISSTKFALKLEHYYTKLPSYFYIADGIPQSAQSSAKWIETSLSSRWTLKCLGVYKNDVEDITSTISAFQDVLFDSGTTYTYLTEDLYNRIVKDLQEVCTVIASNMVACPCFSDDLPTYSFYFQGAKFTLTPQQYLINQEHNYPFCILGLSYLPNMSIMIFGDTTLTYLSTVLFDIGTSSVGLIGLPVIENIDTNGGSIALLSLGALSTISLVTLVIMQIMLKRKLLPAYSELQQPLSTNQYHNDKSMNRSLDKSSED